MRTRNQRGFGVIEILVVLLIVGIVVGVVLKQYMSSTVRSIEQFHEQKPIAHGKVVADQMTLGTVRTALDLYRAQHEQWPADKAAVLALLPGPPRFQCPGNDFEYDPSTGSLRLVIQDPARC
jgi:prepilin-type N-terminal cleavage/methylation domain-containing protein